MKNIKIDQENQEKIALYKELLKKDENSIVNEALSLYFKEKNQEIQERESSQTNLSYEDFWDDFELE